MEGSSNVYIYYINPAHTYYGTPDVTCYHGLLAMMRYATRTVSIVLAAVAVCQADDAAPTAAECITFFTTAQVQDCDAIATFAQCLASTTVDNEFKVRGERVLAKAQEDKPHCNLAVMPKFKVVDREVRAVDMDNAIKQTTLYVVTIGINVEMIGSKILNSVQPYYSIFFLFSFVVSNDLI